MSESEVSGHACILPYYLSALLRGLKTMLPRRGLFFSAISSPPCITDSGRKRPLPGPIRQGGTVTPRRLSEWSAGSEDAFAEPTGVWYLT